MKLRPETHHPVPPGGFTLLELLISVAVFAVVLAAINGVFYGAVRLRNKTAQSIDAALPLQHTLAIIRNDLSNLVPPGGTLLGPLQTSPTASLNTSSTGPNNSARTTPSQAMASQPGQSSPEFFTTGGSIDDTSPWSEVQRVSYFLSPSTNGAAGRDLFRSVSRNLLPSLMDQPVSTPLMTGVDSIQFLYHDGNQWKETWDSTTEPAGRLPSAIKVQLTVAVAERGQRALPPVELVVPVQIYGGTNDTSGATGGSL